MDQKSWNRRETESEESEETGSSEDETDEEEEKQKYVRKENEKSLVVSSAWKKESSSEEESESESGGPVSSPSHVGKNERDPHLTGSRSDSESETDVSSDEAKRSIARLLASDRKPNSKKSAANAPSGKNMQVQREDASKKEKSESQRRKREDQKDEVGNAPKRKKENDGRSPTKGGKTHPQPAQEESLVSQKSKKEKKSASQNGQIALEDDKSSQKLKAVKETSQVQPLERDGPPGKKPRKQKIFSYDDGQSQDPEKSGESDKKQRVTEDVVQGSTRKNGKKERSLEKKDRASEHKEVVSERKHLNQKVENGIELKHASKIPEAAKEVASPQKPKKPSIWTAKDETALAVAVLHRVKGGAEVPVRKSDEFWTRLWEELQGKADGDWTKDQVCEKLRRMNQRYRLMVDRMQAEAPKPYKHRTAHEESLFKIWTHIWGKEASGEEEDEEEEEEDVEEEELIKTSTKRTVSEMNSEEIVPKKPETPVDQERERMDSSDDETDDEDDDEQVLQGHSTGILKGHSTGMDTDQKQTLPPYPAPMVTKTPDSSVAAVQLDQTVVLENYSGHNTNSDNKLLHLAQAAGESSIDDFYKLLQTGNQNILKEVQSSWKQMLEETQAKTLAAVERVINGAGEKFRCFNGMGFSGPSSFGVPVLAGVDFMDLKFLKEDDTAHRKLRQQWYQQHIEELKVYSRRLSLIQEYCHMQQEQLKSHLGTGKV